MAVTLIAFYICSFLVTCYSLTFSIYFCGIPFIVAPQSTWNFISFCVMLAHNIFREFSLSELKHNTCSMSQGEADKTWLTLYLGLTYKDFPLRYFLGQFTAKYFLLLHSLHVWSHARHVSFFFFFFFFFCVSCRKNCCLFVRVCVFFVCARESVLYLFLLSFRRCLPWLSIVRSFIISAYVCEFF